VAIDVALGHTRARETLAERARAIPAPVVLSLVVAASTVYRLFQALAHAVPVYFPDEYIYGTLARSIAETGRPLIRGHAAHFPALLEPLLASPFWLFGDPALAYRLTQAENAVVMSLAAIPAYLLARRLGLGKWFALGTAATAVASPDLFFSSFVVAGPIAYPLVLAALYTGVLALAEPTRRSQIGFVAFTALAAFARIQYVVLPLVFLLAALLVERGSVRRVLSRRRLVFGLFAAVALALLALGPAHTLGYYHGVLDEHFSPSAIVHWTAVDAMLLAYSSGWIAVPGALVGFWLALRRSSGAVERAFGAFFVAFAIALFVEAGVYASNGSDRYQERYLMALVPLVIPAFGIWLRQGAPKRLVVFGLAAAMFAVSSAVPLSGYAAANEKQDSPFLFAVFRFEQIFGIGGGAGLVAAGAGVLAVLATVLAWRPRFAAAVAIVVTATAGLVVSQAAYSLDHANAAAVAKGLLAGDRTWVDDAGLRNVAIVATPGVGAAEGQLEEAFWNRSINSILLLPGATPPDAFGATPVSVQLADATLVDRGGDFELWQPAGRPRLSVLTLGRYTDGWMSGNGEIGIWPDATGWTRGTLGLQVGLLRGAKPTVLQFRGGAVRNVTLEPGWTRTVFFRVNKHGIWSVRFSATRRQLLWDGRVVGVRSAVPTFIRA
jgi:hypothetical protein